MADTTTVRDAALNVVTIATDDVGGSHYQWVKLDLGGDGVSLPVKEHLTTIDFPHARIHAGKSFHVSDEVALGLNATYVIHLATPATGEVHIVWGVRATSEVNIVMTEAPTISVGGNGTAIAVRNRNRQSATAATLTVTHTPTTTAAGTVLETVHLGNAKSVGGEDRAAHEWLLATSQHYLVTITSEASGNAVNWTLDWYEE